MKTFNEYCEGRSKKLDTSEFSQHQIDLGMKVEKEHDGRMGQDTKVTKSDADVLKIVIAHLREDPKYYTKLKQIEN